MYSTLLEGWSTFSTFVKGILSHSTFLRGSLMKKFRAVIEYT